MIWDFNPIAFSVFGLDVRWYSLSYIAGFFLALWWGYRLQQKALSAPLSREQFETLIFGTFFSGVIGGRLGHFLFYSPEIFVQNFSEIFKVWHGGMSIHGGLLGALFFLWWWSREKNISLLRITDILVIPLSVTLIFGRIGNFLNGELVGRPTDQIWGVIFPHIDNQLRHPSQLYEAAKNVILSILLIFFFVQKKWQQKGFLTVSFLVGYGILRFIVEFFKKPEGMILWLTTGQVLCLGMIGIGFLLAKKMNFWHNVP